MQSDLKSSLAFSLAPDESKDTQDNPQLAIFVRFVLSDVTIKELLDLMTTRETTREINIKNALDEAVTRANVSLNKLVSVATNGAPAIMGEHIGLIGLMKYDSNIPEFLPMRCIIHHEHLAAKYFKYENCSRNSKFHTRIW